MARKASVISERSEARLAIPRLMRKLVDANNRVWRMAQQLTAVTEDSGSVPSTPASKYRSRGSNSVIWSPSMPAHRQNTQRDTPLYIIDIKIAKALLTKQMKENYVG